jgi:hypothetical protein
MVSIMEDSVFTFLQQFQNYKHPQGLYCTYSVEGEDVSSDGLLYTKSLYFENENGCLPSFWMSR